MPAVSVIMPAYNVEAYIADAIASVCAQSFVDWELIVVDDGATDGTYEVAAAFAAGDPRVRVFRQPNAGISAARNCALREATGEVFAILDSDDVWAPQFLERQLEMLAAHPDVDIVTGNAWLMGGRDDGKPARPTPDSRPRPDLETIIADEQAVFIMSVFRRRVFETIGEFDETMRCNEDYDFWLRAAAAGFRFYRNDEPLGYYRRRLDSLSASEVKMLRGILRVYIKLREAVLDRPAALAILDAQIARFDTERIAAEAREALEHGDLSAARSHLDALHKRRGGAMLGVATLAARWVPTLLARAYQLRRARQLAL